MNKKNIILVGLMFALLPAAGLADPSLPPWTQGFEFPLVHGTNLNQIGDGWGASDNTVVVQSNTVWTPSLGTNALAIPPRIMASNVVNSASAVSLTNVWTEFYVHPALRMAASDIDATAVDSTMTVQIFVETNGYPVIWHRLPGLGSWQVCSNDFRGTNVAVFSTNLWARVTVCADYSNKVAAVFLDGHLMQDQVPFMNTNQASPGRLVFENGVSSTNYVDEVSVNYSRPATLSADLDNDGVADADEIQRYGTVTNFHRPLITVAQPAHLSIIPVGPFDVMPGSMTNFTLKADPAYVVNQILTNGDSVGSFSWQQSTRTATWSWETIIPDGLSDGSVSGTVTYTRRRYVPEDYDTVQLAMAAALAGEFLVISGGPYSGDVTLSNGVALVVTNATFSENLTLGAGTTGTLSACSGLVVGGTTTVNGLLVVSNGVVNLGSLHIAAGGTVQVVNATSVIANGITMSGNFILDSSWGGGVKAQHPPFGDDFERYTNGMALSGAGYFGWDASASDIVIQTSQAQSNQAVILPDWTSSLNLSLASVSNMWVEWYCQDGWRVPMDVMGLDTVETNLAAMMFINTNGYLVVFNPDLNIWDICSNDAWGVSLTNSLATNEWPRVTVNENYESRKTAVFLNGHLLRQQLRFINTNLTHCATLNWSGGSRGATYLDGLNVWTNADSIVSGDVDTDGIADAREIQLGGSTTSYPRGAVFKIR